MSAHRILILDATGPEASAIGKTAAARGFQVHAAYHHTTKVAVAEANRPLAGTLTTDFALPDAAVETLVEYGRRVGVDGVLTTNEYLTPLVAEVCDGLGLPGNDPALSSSARNKIDMIRRFTSQGVTAPRTCIVKDDADLTEAIKHQLTFPCVVKPAAGAGSAGVTVVHDATAALEAVQAARRHCGMYGITPDPRAIVQEYVRGVEYSVESLVSAGTTHHLCVTHKTVTGGNHRVELGHALPATLGVDLRRAVLAEVDRAIAAAGIRNGPAHTEVIVTPDGRCLVIEIGARIGAGQIGFLIQHALDIDPWAACLDIAIGKPVTAKPTRSGYAAVRFITCSQPGRLVSVTGLPNPGPEVPAVRVRRTRGEVVGVAKDNSGRIGSVMVVGRDRQSVEHLADRLLASIHVEVEPIELGLDAEAEPR